MIKKSTIDWFLTGRQLRDLSKVKQFTIDKFDGIAAQEGLKTDPYLHQLASFFLATKFKAFLFLLDMGLGKSRTVLAAFNYWRARGEAHRSLIVTGGLAGIGSWLREIEKHSDFKAVPVTAGTIEEKCRAFDEDSDIHVVDYTGLQFVLATRRPIEGSKKTEYQPDPLKIADMSGKFDFLILDEIHSCKNRESLRFGILSELVKTMPFKYGLTGTLFGNDPFDAWAQFFLIDGGESLGRSFYLFREALGKEVYNHWARTKREWVYDPKKSQYLTRMIKNRSISYATAECLDLPKRTDTVQSVFPTGEILEHYQRAIDGIIKAGGDITLIKNAFVRLRQIVSGFIDWADEDTGERRHVKFDPNPKIDFLSQFFDDLPTQEKVVIFCEFVRSGEMISECLSEKKIGHVRLYGGTKDKLSAVEEFLTKDATRVLVANSLSGGISLNLQVARYVVFYETPLSPIVREQAERRVYRTGQEKPVFFYDLVVSRTIEWRLLQYVKSGKDLLDEVVRRGAKKVFMEEKEES